MYNSYIIYKDKWVTKILTLLFNTNLYLILFIIILNKTKL